MGSGSATPLFHLKGNVTEHRGLSLPSRGNSSLPSRGNILLSAEAEVAGRGFFCKSFEVSVGMQKSYQKAELQQGQSFWNSVLAEQGLKLRVEIAFPCVSLGLISAFWGKWIASEKLLTPLPLFLLTWGRPSIFCWLLRFKSINVFYSSNKRLFPYRISPNWAPVYKQKGRGFCFSLVNMKPWMWSSHSVREPSNWQSGHSWQPHWWGSKIRGKEGEQE